MKTSASISRRRGTLLLLSLLFALAFVAGIAIAEPSPSNTSADSLTVERLAAFARLYGYVRFFHPSDEAAMVDWETFAVYGAARVLALGNGEGFDALLRELFTPVAPTLRLYPAGEEPPAPAYEQPAETDGLRVVAWQHFGVGLDQPFYKSARSGQKPRLETPRFGTVAQGIPASALRGRDVRLRAAVKAQVEGDDNQAQLWLRVDRPGGEMGFFDNMEDRPIKSSPWRLYEIEGTVAEDAEMIAFGGFLLGHGKAWFDAFDLSVDTENGTWQPVPLENPGFELDAAEATGWFANSLGYEYSLVTDAHGGQQSMLISASIDTVSLLFPELPAPGEAISKDIGAGLAIHLPLALWSNEGTTLGKHPEMSSETLFTALESFDLKTRDTDKTALNLGAVVIAWNVFQHFYPYFDTVDTDWLAELTARLDGALQARDARDHYRNLKRLTAALGDGHANVYHAGFEARQAGLPLNVEWIEDQIVVVASEVDGIERGDVLVSLDGGPAVERLQRDMELVSGSAQWKRYLALSSLTRGEMGSTAQLVLRRLDQELKVSAERRFNGRLPKAFSRQPIEELGDGIYYVDLSSASMEEIRARLSDLAAAPGVVLDLRGYPKGNHEILSHLTDEPLQSARWNVSQILYPDQKGRIGWDTSGRWNLPPVEPRLQGKAVFITDGRAISYAESVLGIVEAYALAPIVGQATAAANGNVNPFLLPGGYRVAWTGMKVLKHDGSQHHLVGIQPTLPCERSLAGVRAGRDELLERALAEIRSKR